MNIIILILRVPIKLLRLQDALGTRFRKSMFPECSQIEEEYHSVIKYTRKIIFPFIATSLT